MDEFSACNTDCVSSLQVASAGWVKKMRDDYRKTGRYESEDLRRLLGDPTKGVSAPKQAQTILVEVSRHSRLDSKSGSRSTGR